MTICRRIMYMLLIVMLTAVPGVVRPDEPVAPPVHAGKAVHLVKAVMCEEVIDNRCANVTAVFSLSKGSAYCFSEFDPVAREGYVYHHWLKRDVPITKIKLAVKPPRWSTYSRIHLRENDKGPWRVDILDEEENVLTTLRFSIVD